MVPKGIRPIQARDVAAAMLAATVEGKPGVHVLSSAAMQGENGSPADVRFAARFLGGWVGAGYRGVSGPLVLFPVEAPETPLTRQEWLAATRVAPDEWAVAGKRAQLELRPFMAITDQRYRLYSFVA